MGVPLREYQLFGLGILKEFSRICDQHNLTWWIGYGSLLGAARHKGFIPWDDDIDVWMMPDDYLAFREICRTKLNSEYYLKVHSFNPANSTTWQCLGVRNTTSIPRNQLDVPADWGVCMDIFPLVPCPDPETPRFSGFLKRIRSFQRLSSKYVYANDVSKTSGLRKLYNKWRASGSDEQNIAKWLAVENALFNDKANLASGWVSNIDCIEPADSYKRSWFDSTVYLDYEDMKVPAPGEYQKVLAHSYGEDWAQIPDESSDLRWCHSGGGSDDVIVSLDTPYTDYWPENRVD